MKKIFEGQRIFAVFMASLIVFGIFCVMPSTRIEADAASTPVLNSTDVTLFGMDDTYEDYISISSDCLQSFQFKVTGASGTVSWRVKSGNSVKIDSNGVVTPKTTTWYWNGNIGSTVSSGAEGERVEVSYNFGTSIIAATVDGQTLEASVTVKNYAEYYAQGVIKDYMKENITSSMTDMEKLEQICKFIANYDYSGTNSGYVGMVIMGEGDCWSSTYCMDYMCQEAGLKSHVRYAAIDANASSGHRNCAVLIDGEVYVADAGYTGTAPRYYSITKLPDGFSYSLSNGEAKITQYDGFDTVIAIPKNINGYPVTTIGKNILYYNQAYNDLYVTDISIPSTVSSISEFAFSDSGSLKNVTVADDNADFCDINGVLYSKDKSVLVYYPNGREGAYAIASSVKTIKPYAFYYSKKLTAVTVPSGVTILDEGTFGDCTALTSVTLPDTLKTIEDFAFYYCSNLKEITIPQSVTTISDNAFSVSSMTVYGISGSAAETFASNKGYTFVAIQELTNTSTISSDSIIKGQEITLTGSANGGTGSYQYQIVAKHSEDTKWTVLSGYNTTSIKKWTPAKAGTYKAAIKVKDSTGKIVEKLFTLTVAPALTNSSTINATEIAKGQEITLTGSASGGTGSYQYQMLAKHSEDTKWTVLNGYNTTSVKKWTPAKAGTYKVAIKVKDSSNKVVEKLFTLTVNPATALVNNSIVSANSIIKGEEMTLTGKAIGGTGSYQYQMVAKHSEDTKWTVLKDYNTTSVKKWTPAKTGTYKIAIKVKDGTGKTVEKLFSLTVNPAAALINNSTISADSIIKGEEITLTGKASGGVGSYQYQMAAKHSEDTKWTVLSGYNTTSVKKWTPAKAGTYKVAIKIKDSAGEVVEKIFTLTVNAVSTNDSSEADTITLYANEVIRLVNEERSQNGLSEFETREDLCKVACVRAEELSESYSHTRPDGSEWYTLIDESSISYRSIAENIAYGYSTPESVVQAWMSSEGHKANILSSEYDGIGVGCYEKDGTFYWVQYFVKSVS